MLKHCCDALISVIREGGGWGGRTTGGPEVNKFEQVSSDLTGGGGPEVSYPGGGAWMGGTLYSGVQCIMGNDHWTYRQTR